MLTYGKIIILLINLHYNLLLNTNAEDINIVILVTLLILHMTIIILI